jgi:hypothetical protein
MKYSIVVPTYNRCDDLLRPCLETLQQYTDLTDAEVIVVANGCTDNTRNFVESLGYPFKLIWFDQAIGYTKATNAGMSIAVGEFVIPFSNDVSLLPAPKNDWINRLHEPFINNPKMALTGDLMLYSEDAGDHFIVFQCAMIKRSVMAEIGALDEVFSPGYGEDIDFSMRVRQRGYEWKCVDTKTYDGVQWVGTFPSCHIGTATFKTIPEYGSVIVPRNQAILRERYSKPTGLKLHLACGFDYLEGYVNVDLYPQPGARVDASFDVKKLPYADNTVDEVRALHIIEHFDFFEGQEVLKEWCRVLKPGGKLILETPDFLESCRAFVNGTEDDRIYLYGHFFAQAWIPGQIHKFLFTESQLKTQLAWAGFDRVNRIAPMSNYLKNYSSEKIFLAVEAYKI